MFKTRLMSGIVLVILALLLIITGGPILLTSLGIISIIGLYELYRVVQIHKSVLGFVGYAAIIFHYINLQFQVLQELVTYLVLVMMVMLMLYVLSFPKFHANQVFAAFFGVIYVGMMISYVYQTRMLEYGQFIVWLIFLSSWGCDTCA